MFLTKQKISFIIPVLTRVDEKIKMYEEILEEIKKLVENGAEVKTFMFLTGGENLRNIPLDWRWKLECLTGKKAVILLGEFYLDIFTGSDLIIIAPCPYILWEELVHLRIHENLILVIAPYREDSGEDKEAGDYIHLLSLLLRKKEFFFVPFGPVGEKGTGLPFSEPAFLSRFDLVAEAAWAASLKKQIQPVVLEIKTLPA